MNSAMNNYETPFADVLLTKEEPSDNGSSDYRSPGFVNEHVSPFSRTFETTDSGTNRPEHASDIAQLLGELNDPEFSTHLYELAAEAEDTWRSKISDETSMGESFLPFVKQHAADYFRPLIKASEGMIDRISGGVKGSTLSDLSAAEVENFLNEFEPDATGLTPVQEQFLGSLFKKAKSVVQKAAQVVGKIMPINIILDKLKGLVRPLLDRVLKFAIGKLPANLQPYAQTLAKKLLNMETPFADSSETTAYSTGDLDAVQTELDNEITRLVFSDEADADHLTLDYESSVSGNGSLEYPSHGVSLDSARQQLIRELSGLQQGESAAPAIERFLPVAFMALRPLIKTGISIVGRPKVINFLAGILAQLVSKYVPQQVAQPLAASIIDAGMTAIGFETYEMNKPDVGYEALVNTIQDTLQNINLTGEAGEDDQETLTLNMLEAFETAAANNFPHQYIREEVRTGKTPGLWVLKPRNGLKPSYKKYTRVYTVTIDPQTSKSVLTFRGLPLADFLRDKLSLDPSKPVQAKVHLFESIPGTWLSGISKSEDLPGLGSSHPYSWVQLHPLTVQAASLLINEPALGKDFPPKFTSKRSQIAVGQRFYYLEINGARLKVTGKTNGPAHSADVSCTVDLTQSSVSVACYYSEEMAKTLVERLNQNDFMGVSMQIRHMVKKVIQGMLLGHVGGKVKIIHEAFPELYLENYEDPQEHLLGTGKTLLTGLIESVVNKAASAAFQAIRDFFKARAAEFKQAQAEPQDGVTLSILWVNVPGLSSVKALLSAIRGNQPFNPSMLSIPGFSAPQIKIKAGKHIR